MPCHSAIFGLPLKIKNKTYESYAISLHLKSKNVSLNDMDYLIPMSWIFLAFKVVTDACGLTQKSPFYSFNKHELKAFETKNHTNAIRKEN